MPSTDFPLGSAFFPATTPTPPSVLLGEVANITNGALGAKGISIPALDVKDPDTDLDGSWCCCTGLAGQFNAGSPGSASLYCTLDFVHDYGTAITYAIGGYCLYTAPDGSCAEADYTNATHITQNGVGSHILVPSVTTILAGSFFTVVGGQIQANTDGSADVTFNGVMNLRVWRVA